MKITTFDTTLRKGTQGESVSFSVEDKLLITQKLDDFGIDYIEAGWPGSNPKDREFFAAAASLPLKHARLTAFGSLRFPRHTFEEDSNLRALVEAGTPAVSIFGQAWDREVERTGISLNDNLNLISETVKYLVNQGREVIYEAEHFFDGYAANPRYALWTLEAAQNGGAAVLCLCDTNGGSLTTRLVDALADVRKRFDGVIGIQAHNDSDLAVANTLAAVEAGATHIQGSMNGYGERCGSANLASVLPNLELKLGHTTVGAEKLAGLTSVCRFIAELANLQLRHDQPFVGRSAFAHKGGAQVAAVLQDPTAYEHVRPDAVGNRQRMQVGDLSGGGNILFKLKQHGLADRLDEHGRRELLERIKQMELEGYELGSAEGTFELLVREAMNPGLHFFDVESYEVSTRAAAPGVRSHNTATVTLRAHDGLHTATATGNGSFHALHRALRGCLAKVYPQVAKVRLTDYKVRVLNSRKGTAARARVLIEWSDHRKSWVTVGISDNVVAASWKALIDAIRLELMRLAEKDASVERAVEDYCWGV